MTKINPELSRFIADKLKQEKIEREAPNRFKNFTTPQVMVDGEAQNAPIATDGVNGSSLAINQMTLNAYNALVVNNWFLGYGELTILSQNGILRNIVQTISDEVIKEWIEVIDTKQDNDENQQERLDIIKKIMARAEQLDMRSVFQAATRNTMIFGGCMIYPKLKNDDKELDKELIIDDTKLNKDCLKYLKIVEPVYCYPIEYNTDDPLALNFYNPQLWNLLSRTVHISRLCHLKYNTPPLLLLPTYMFFGIPLIQMILPYLTSFESLRKNIDGIVQRYNKNVIKTNMSALVDYDESTNPFEDIQTFETRMAYLNTVGDNFGTLALDFKTEAYEQFTMSLTGLDKLYSQAAEIVCAVARTPATKVFGTAPQGFNSTGEHEADNFYDFIRNIQNSLNPHINKVLDLIQIDLFGKIDPMITFKWKPLKSPNKVEEADVRLKNAQTDLMLKQEGLVATTEVRTRMSQDPNSGYTGIDSTNPELDEPDTDEQDINDNETDQE